MAEDEARKLDETYDNFGMEGVDEKPSSPAWLKLLIGCGIGCGVLALIGGGLIAWMVWLVVSPGEQVPTSRILGPETVGHVSLGDPTESEALVAYLEIVDEEFTRLAQELRAEEMPESLRWLEGFGGGRGSLEPFIEIAPTDTTLAFEQSAVAGELEVVFAANFRRYVRLARFFLGLAAGEEMDLQERNHRGADVYVSDGDTAFAFLGGTVVIAETEATLEIALDRILDWAPEADPEPLDTSGPESWLVHGEFDTRDGLLERALLDVTKERTREVLEPIEGRTIAFERLAFLGRLDSADAATVRIRLELDDPRVLGDVLPRVTEAARRLADVIEEQGLQTELTVEVDQEAAIDVVLVISGLRATARALAKYILEFDDS